MTLESARLEKSQKRPRTHPVTPVPCDADEVSYDAISPLHRLVTRASCDANDPSHDARASSAPECDHHVTPTTRHMTRAPRHHHMTQASYDAHNPS